MLLASISFGQAPSSVPEIKTAQTTQIIKIDGEIEESEWQGAFVQDGLFDPVTGQGARNRTKVFLTYNQEALFVAFRCYALEPSDIIAREIRIGAEFEGEDFVGFTINPFGTRSGSGTSDFFVNPLNTQSDDIAGGRSSKREWRGEWTSGAKRLEDGWSVEMRIPWKVLNYPSGKDLNMDVIFARVEGKRQAKSFWPNIGLQEFSDRSARWLGVSPPPAALKPFQYLGYIAPEYDRTSSGVRAGLDVRYQPTSTVTGLLSVNPDFRNIEAQIAGIDFTRTERFLNDVRPFFTEGSDFFRTGGFFGYGNLFYSNRIQEMDWGAKSFGRITNRLDYGALVANDTGKQSVGVFRIHQDPGQRGDMSLFGTTLNRPGGYRHEALGGSYYTQRGSFAWSGNAAVEKDQSRAYSSAGNVSMNYQVPNWFSDVTYRWIKPDFAPPLGFIPWTDRKGFSSYTEYFREFRKGGVRDVNANIFGTYFEQYDGQEQEKGFEASAGMTTRNDVRLGVNHTNTRYFGKLDRVFGVFISPNQSNRFRKFSIYTEAGQRGGVSSNFTSLQASYRLFKRMDLGLSHSVITVGDTDRQTIATLGYEFSRTMSVTGRLVDSNGRRNGYLAFRNGGGSGTEYYLIVGDPNTQEFVSRVSVKVVFAF